jgi:hypothetical protein
VSFVSSWRFVSQPLQQRTQLGNHRNATHFTVLCSCNRVSANGDLGFVKSTSRHVTPIASESRQPLNATN